MRKILISGITPPPSLWSLYRRSRRGLFPSKSYQKWKTNNAKMFDEKTPITPLVNVCVSIRIWSGKGIRGETFDLDNYAKAILDQLKRSFIIADDSVENVRKLNISYEGKLKNATFEVYVREMNIKKVKEKKPNAKAKHKSRGSEEWDYTDQFSKSNHDHDESKSDSMGESDRNRDDQC